MITVGGASVSSSPRVKVRPMTGRTPSISKKSTDGAAPDSCSGSPAPVKVWLRLASAVRWSKSPDAVPLSRHSRKSANDTSFRLPKPCRASASQSTNSRVESANGRGRHNTPRAIANAVVVAPMPTASVMMAVTENVGLLNSSRQA